MRTIILDGYNVIHRSPAFDPEDLKDLAGAREKLINLLSWVMGSEGDASFVLVFDGANVGAASRRSAGSGGRVDVRFSTPPQTADDLIKALVEEWSRSKSGLTVVTSDIDIAQHARAHDASVVLSDLFGASLFRERVEAKIQEAVERSAVKPRGKRGAGRAGAGAEQPRTKGTPKSPTAEGSDAETKPGMTKKEREEWLRLFDEQREEKEY